MILDIHTHIFPRSVREDRAAFFTDEPAFELLYQSPKAKLIGVEDLIAAMDAQGVDRAVTFCFPWRNADYFKAGNDYVLEAVSRFPRRLIGFCCLDVAHPEAAAEVERCLQAGLAGIGELAFYCSDLDCACTDSLEPIMALGRQFQCPVMIHTNEPVGHAYPGKTANTLAQIYALVRRYPRNRIILAHWGGGLFFFNLLKKEVRESLANVWFDTAASPFLYQPEIYSRAIELAGLDKVLYGSDFPLLPPQRYFKEMAQAGLSREQLAAVKGGNAAGLFNIKEI